MIVGKNEVILKVYEDFPSARLAQQELVDSTCVLGQDGVLVVALVSALGEAELGNFPHWIVLQLLKSSLHPPVPEVKVNENGSFFGLSFFVPIDQTKQTQELLTLDIKFDFFLLLGWTAVQPIVVQNNWRVVKGLEYLHAKLVVWVEEV